MRDAHAAVAMLIKWLCWAELLRNMRGDVIVAIVSTVCCRYWDLWPVEFCIKFYVLRAGQRAPYIARLRVLV